MMTILNGDRFAVNLVTEVGFFYLFNSLEKY